MRNTSVNPFWVIVLGTLIALVAPLYPQKDSQIALLDLGKILITGGLGGAVFGRSNQQSTQVDVGTIEIEPSKREPYG
jgi:hypothetical protein